MAKVTRVPWPPLPSLRALATTTQLAPLRPSPRSTTAPQLTHPVTNLPHPPSCRKFDAPPILSRNCPHPPSPNQYLKTHTPRHTLHAIPIKGNRGANGQLEREANVQVQHSGALSSHCQSWRGLSGSDA